MFKYVSDVSILAHNIISEYVENKNIAFFFIIDYNLYVDHLF